MKLLTLKELQSADAFVQVTAAQCIEVAGTFDWDWAAQNLLPEPAWAKYDQARAAAWVEYERVRAAAWAKYERVRAAAFGRLYGGGS